MTATTTAPSTPAAKSNTFLVDAENLLRRCYHGGGATRGAHVLHTFFAGLLRFMDHHRRGVTLVVWDGGHAEWRTRLHPGYKERPAKPGDARKMEDLAVLREQVQELGDAMGIRSVRFEGVEADDLIAYIARAVTGAARILSSDMDFAQLVRHDPPSVRLYRRRKGETETISPDTIEEKTSCATAYHYRLVKAMAGDKSDNIAGVEGVGDLTACQIVAHIPDAAAILPTSPGRGLDAVIEICRAARSSRWRRVAEQREAAALALRLTDLCSARLLPIALLYDLVGVLIAERVDADPGLHTLLERHAFPERFRVGLDERLARRVHAFAPGSFSFEWAEDPEEGDTWGL